MKNILTVISLIAIAICGVVLYELYQGNIKPIRKNQEIYAVNNSLSETKNIEKESDDKAQTIKKTSAYSSETSSERTNSEDKSSAMVKSKPIENTTQKLVESESNELKTMIDNSLGEEGLDDNDYLNEKPNTNEDSEQDITENMDKNATDSSLAYGNGDENRFKTGTAPGGNVAYVGNANNHKLHLPTCRSLPIEENQVLFYTKEEAIAAGYSDSCGICCP